MKNKSATEMLVITFGWPDHVAKLELELASVSSNQKPEEIAKEMIELSVYPTPKVA